jgi:Rps23 Pro-64 3,4-dihydroxylase Tpa1-like proline 4-hydroxylase
LTFLIFFLFFLLPPFALPIAIMSPTVIGSSDNNTLEPLAKRLKTTRNPIHNVFHDGLFHSSTKNAMREAVTQSKPYQHCKIDQLVNDELLRQVRHDILNNIQFTRKETDIYKVRRGGRRRRLALISFLML